MRRRNVIAVTHWSRAEWYVVHNPSWGVLAGPYSSGRSARYVARALREVLEREPLPERE